MVCIWPTLCSGNRISKKADLTLGLRGRSRSLSHHFHGLELKKNVEDLTSTLGDAASQQYERAQDVAKDTVHRTEETIRRNPFSAILTALGLGFLVGLFKGGRR
jgi:ElaB/YqjD/DUF883 family membrane-anchored ribosome-binding protein